jgi:hypothetical protein
MHRRRESELAVRIGVIDKCSFITLCMTRDYCDRFFHSWPLVLSSGSNRHVACIGFESFAQERLLHN